MTDIRWSVRLADTPERVYHYLSTDAGREQFWAESAIETDGTIEFVFPSGETYTAEILATDPYERFVIDYFDSPASFSLQSDETGGTILTLTHSASEGADRCELRAGWVSVLLALKASVNFAVDLRNHDQDYTWRDNFVGN